MKEELWRIMDDMEPVSMATATAAYNSRKDKALVTLVLLVEPANTIKIPIY